MENDSTTMKEENRGTVCTILSDKISPLQKRNEICLLLQTEANYDIFDPLNTTKRTDYLSWDDYFMSISFLAAKRSKDPQDQNGATIVDEKNKIIGVGYNGFPMGCHDTILPWATRNDTKKSILLSKEAYLCHAAVNAILNKISSDIYGSSLFLTTFPCEL